MENLSRRRILALSLGIGASWRWLPGTLTGADAPIRLGISESMVTDVNINDARAAMLIWIKRMMADLNIAIDFNPKIFDTTEEILRLARDGQLDALALNVVEYKQIADVLDSSQIIAESGAAGPEQYLLLVKRDSGIQHLSDLRGRRLMMLKAPKMCVAPAWLSTILEEGRFGTSEQFFASVTTYTKASRVVLPVFFGQAEGCLASKQGFDTMCELNPQVGRELAAIASSPAMIVTFYVFRKDYHGALREKFAKIYSTIGSSSAAGQQLATLFQFKGLIARSADCLAPALAVLESAERIRNSISAGSRKR